MDKKENGTIKYLKMIVGFQNSHIRHNTFKYSCAEDFVLVNGREYAKVYKFSNHLFRGKMNECFRNATLLSIEKDWAYIEGYATSIIPTLHAWCIDEDGRVVDPTWLDGCDYFGVEFHGDYLRKTILKRKKYGVIDNMEMGFPLLTGEHPYPYIIRGKERIL